MTDFPTRVQYHPGQNLGSALFTTEQQYHVSMRERHNLAAHEWGIALGLDLAPDAVGPGLAVDGYGRELVLPVRTPIDAGAAFDLLGTDSVDVALVYRRVVEPPGDVAVERPAIVLDRAAGPSADRRHPPVATGDEDFDATRAAPHDLTHPWPVYLGTLTRDPAAPPDAVPMVRTAGRPAIGVRAARVVAPDGGVELALDDGVTLTDPSRVPQRPGAPAPPVLRWSERTLDRPARLDVDGTLSVEGDLTVGGGRVILPQAVPATSRTGWRIDHVKADFSGEDPPHTEQLRLVVGNPQANVGRPEFVVGAFVDGKFTECLTVSGDGTVTVHGNLIVHGTITELPGSRP